MTFHNNSTTLALSLHLLPAFISAPTSLKRITVPSAPHLKSSWPKCSWTPISSSITLGWSHPRKNPLKTVGPQPDSRPKAARRQPNGRPKANYRPRVLPKIGLNVDPAESPALPQQAPGTGRAEMAAMGRGFSHAVTADKEGAAMTLRTITPPITAGRGRAAPAARNIKPAVAPPLPVRARTRDGRRVGERVPFPRTLLLAPRSFLARTSVSEAGVRAPPTASGWVQT